MGGMWEIISSMLNLLLGSGLVGILFFYRSKQRKESAEATQAEMGNRQVEFDIHRQSIEFLSGQLSEAYTEVSKLQDIVNDKRDDIIELIRQTKQLEIDIIERENLIRRASIAACYRVDCGHRKEVADDDM